jgi:hypothetical protein
VESSPPLLRPLIGLLYQPWMIDGDDCGAVDGMTKWQDEPKYSEITCSSVALSTTDPTRLDPDSNPGRRSGMPATNRLSYGAVTSRLVTSIIPRTIHSQGKIPGSDWSY